MLINPGFIGTIGIRDIENRCQTAIIELCRYLTIEHSITLQTGIFGKEGCCDQVLGNLDDFSSSLFFLVGPYEKRNEKKFFFGSGVGLSLAALFLAFRNVPLPDLLKYIISINYHWIWPSIALILTS
jgi:hypothetical protein